MRGALRGAWPGYVTVTQQPSPWQPAPAQAAEPEPELEVKKSKIYSFWVD